MKQNLNVAVIGFGGHGESHFNSASLQNNPNLFFSGVFDPNQERQQAFKKLFPKSLIYESEDALMAAKPDAILVFSGDKYHFPTLVKCMAANIPVFCEKPLCCTADKLELLKTLLFNAELGTVSSCHPRRFDPPYQKGLELLGELVNRHNSVQTIKLQFRYTQPSTWDKHTSLWLDHGSHEVDYLMAIVDILKAQLNLDYSLQLNLIDDSPQEYLVVGRLIDSRGLVINVVFQGSRLLAGKHSYPESIDFQLEKQDVSINTVEGRATILNKTSYSNYDTQGAQYLKFSGTDYDGRLDKILLNFFNALLGNEQPYLSPKALYYNNAIPVLMLENNLLKMQLE